MKGTDRKLLIAINSQSRAMAKIRITQIRSGIDRTDRQKKTIRALGITKLNVPVVHEDTPQIQGMITKVHHLVKVEKV